MIRGFFMKKLLILMILFPLVCFGQTRPHWLQLEGKPVVDVREFGAKGDGVTDDTDALQAAIDAGSTVVFPSGTYMVRRRSSSFSSLSVPSDRALLLAPNATIKLLPYNSTHAYIFDIRSENVFISGGTIDGSREDNSATTGEWGMGLHIYNAKNVSVENLTTKDNWGDGIYLGASSSGKNENISIRNVTSTNNRRQGMSVISVSGLLVENSRFMNTNGTDPQAGIDFEPNHADQSLDNIKLVNISTASNTGPGILWYPPSVFKQASKTVSLTIEGWDSVEDHYGFSAFGAMAPGNHKGIFSLSNVSVTRSKAGSIRFADWTAAINPQVYIRNVELIDSNTGGIGGVSNGGSPLSLIVTNENSTPVGNISVDGFRRVYTGEVTTYNNTYSMFFPRGAVNISLRNLFPIGGGGVTSGWSVYNLPHLSINKNDISGLPKFWASSSDGDLTSSWPNGLRTLDLVRVYPNVTRTDLSGHLTLKLREFGSSGNVATHTTVPMFVYEAGTFDGSSVFIESPTVAKKIYPYGTDRVSFPRVKGSYVEFQQIMGEWYIKSSNVTLTGEDGY